MRKTSAVLFETELPNLVYRGKVRDTYALDGDLLLVATDRISAFDMVLPNGVPDKGRVLTQLSAFWFEQTRDLMPNHMIEVVDDVRMLHARTPRDVCYAFPAYLEGRSMVVRRAERVDVECVVRGYMSGSAWVEYQRGGSVCGIQLPAGLRESEQLPEPIFTPTTKADSGHDQPVTMEELRGLIGRELADALEDKSIAVYCHADAYARGRGIIVADTKFEFGFIDGKLSLIDELLTPDSSRFWDAATYEPGRSQPSFDKQYARDWLAVSGWNKEPPAPVLPKDVVEKTAEKYREAYRRLTGRKL